ncbi:NADH-FMN oxidoreductase RutF, flavin reductase (DIM6/NTAB) family [Rathayibacter oskolensis]|uniref:NADH-FMN oxidoreductase RutF, flavin reductase (DIM6/NTAB) family n=1 Tax=Rathayibacter oskolensis TaxID=1891671 RepID=A0A1X7PJN8_9MICO|nr:flavin reductase family protein [Rathayibacter oskolensis]SMH50903.1 NADH-FMN oxidoreductase RutF, flavin reductase (DIM6/NTAB) family [Rathayibacter oskolensis]
MTALALTRLEDALAHVPSAVAAVAAMVDGAPEGLVATSLSVGASFDPPLVMFAVREASTTWPLLRTSPRIGVSMLSEAQGEATRRLASRTRHRRFEGLSREERSGGAVLVGGSSLRFECSVHAETPAGDHRVVLLRVHSLELDPGVEPLVYHRSGFRALRDAS